MNIVDQDNIVKKYYEVSFFEHVQVLKEHPETDQMTVLSISFNNNYQHLEIRKIAKVVITEQSFKEITGQESSDWLDKKMEEFYEKVQEIIKQ